MRRKSTFWSVVLIFGTLSTSAVAVPIFSTTEGICVTGSGSETVIVYGGVGVAVDQPPTTVCAGAQLYTKGEIAPAVLDLTWSFDVNGAGCCFEGGSFGGTVWDLETGVPVPVYSWSHDLPIYGNVSIDESFTGSATLPFKIGIPFSVGFNASMNFTPPDQPDEFPAAAGLSSAATVSVGPVPEPGTFALMLAALAATGVLKTRRTRRT
jgi:hypothetical protein